MSETCPHTETQYFGDGVYRCAECGDMVETPKLEYTPGASAGREPSYWENQWRRDVMDPHLSDNMRLGIALCLIGEIDSRNVSLRSALAAERAAGEAMRDALRDFRDNFDHEEQTHDHMPGKYGGTCRTCLAARALAADRETEET